VTEAQLSTLVVLVLMALAFVCGVWLGSWEKRRHALHVARMARLKREREVA